MWRAHAACQHVMLDTVAKGPSKRTMNVLKDYCYAGRVGGYSAAQVEEVRMVMRMLPIFFTTILFWTIYCQVWWTSALVLEANPACSKP